MNRRNFIEQSSKAGIGSIALVGGLGMLQACGSSKKNTKTNELVGGPGFLQAPLPYSYQALEPYIDSLTMEIHYSKHAAAYTKNMNDAIKEEKVAQRSLEAILAGISGYSEKLRNNAGGHYNHESFWKWMTPGGKPMSSGFQKQIETSFGSVSDFKFKLADATTKRFGSGWAWLAVDVNKKLLIGSTPNQDNPLMDLSSFKGFPVLGIDVWEHAYYLKYQNKRADYFTAWWGIINWPEVEARFAFAMDK